MLKYQKLGRKYFAISNVNLLLVGLPFCSSEYIKWQCVHTLIILTIAVFALVCESTSTCNSHEESLFSPRG